MSGLAVAGVASLTYARTLGFGFIYDDYWTVVNNRDLDRPLRELVAGVISGRSVEWGMPDATRPLMGLSLWFDRRGFDLSPAGYHLHSVALYALACVLVLLLAFGLLRRLWPALGAALVFAVAPLHVEVALVVNYREDLLAAVGLLGATALLFWPMRREWRWRSYLCGALWGYALLGKESAIVGPLIILALSLVRRPVLEPRSGSPTPVSVVCGAVAILWLNWRYGLSRLNEQIPTATYASWGERLLRTARFEVVGVYQSLLPFGPRPEQDPRGPAHWLWLVALVALVGGVVVLARQRRTRVLAGAVAVALVAPLCTSPLLAPINEYADRYWFVGSVAAGLVVGWAIRVWSPQRSWLAVVLLVCGLGVSSWKASSVWASEVDLWTFAVQTAPGSSRAWAQLSRAHRLAGQEVLAERTVERALALTPERLSVHAVRLLNLLWFGKLTEARTALASLRDTDRVHGDSLKAAQRCVLAADAEAASACARRSVPRGLVLGDTERLRVVSEHMLSLPLDPSAPPPREPEPRASDAGADAAHPLDPAP